MQKDALKSILKTLSADQLAIPQDKLSLFPPRAHGYFRGRESFKSNSGVAFDALGAAQTASDMTLALLLHPQRANRMIEQKAINPKQLGFEEMLDQLLDKTLHKKVSDAYLEEVQRTINYNVLKHLMNLSIHKQAIPQVKAFAKGKLAQLKDQYQAAGNSAAQEYFMYTEITKFLEDPKDFKVLPSPKIPDGSPIGCFEEPISTAH